MVPGSLMEEKIPAIERNPWIDNVFRPVLITVMIMCVSISMVNLVRFFNPAWRGAYFLAGMLLTTVEAIFSYRVLQLRRPRGMSRLRYHLAEWTVLIVALKILSFANKSPAAIWAEIQLIWRDPLSFISIEYYLLLGLAMIVWVSASQTMVDFEELYDPYTFYSDHVLPLDSLADRFFWGGVMLVVISGVTQWLHRASLASLIDFRRPSLGGIIFNVLLYFTLGLVLLSQTQLSRLQVRWHIQKITVASDLTRRWAKYGLIFLGLVGLLVFLLPTGYSLGFLTSAGLFIQYGLSLVNFIIQLLLLLLLLPLMWLLSLFGQEPPWQLRQPAAPLFGPDTPSGAALPPWLEVLRSLIFWLVIGGMAWYLIRIYLNDHPELVQGLKRFRPLGFILGLLAELWQRLAGLTQAGWDLIPKRIWRAGRSGSAGRLGYRRWAGLGSLSPRERVLYYYLNILERTKKRGPTRRAHQTPYEFEPELSQAAPEADQEVNILTEAFVHARYSRRSFDEAQAGLARILWQRIRRALSERNRGAQGSEAGPGPVRRKSRF